MDQYHQEEANRIAVGVNERTNTVVVTANDAMYKNQRNSSLISTWPRPTRAPRSKRSWSCIITSADATERALAALGGEVSRSTPIRRASTSRRTLRTSVSSLGCKELGNAAANGGNFKTAAGHSALAAREAIPDGAGGAGGGYGGGGRAEEFLPGYAGRRLWWRLAELLPNAHGPGGGGFGGRGFGGGGRAADRAVGGGGPARRSEEAR